MLSRGVACPKPEPRKRTKARKARAEGTVRTSVRALCVERDHACRLGSAFWKDEIDRPLWPPVCDGPSEWAHLAGHRRSQTRGQAPEQRHDSRHSLMLCRRHHRQEERGTLRITYLTNRGCDGPLKFKVHT